MKLNIKSSTYARIGALAVALVNQCLAIFGKGVLPFTENMAYQIISLIVTVVVVCINAWYNNDVTDVAILSGKVFDAVKDGKITEEEVVKLLAEYEAEKELAKDKEPSMIVSMLNNLLKKIKGSKPDDKE